MPRLHLKLLFACGTTVEGELITGPEHRYKGGVYSHSQLLHLFNTHEHQNESAQVLDISNRQIGSVYRTVAGSGRFDFATTSPIRG